MKTRAVHLRISSTTSTVQSLEGLEYNGALYKMQGGGEAPDEARHSGSTELAEALDLFVQATAGRFAKPSTKPAIASHRTSKRRWGAISYPQFPSGVAVMDIPWQHLSYNGAQV
jgi:hypothetical protein